jgi:predicted lipoprotein
LNLGTKVIFSKTYLSFLDKVAQVFGEICDSIKKPKDGKVIWVSTVIFEGSTSKEVIKELYKTVKQMSSDNVQARCILVLLQPKF